MWVTACFVPQIYYNNSLFKASLGSDEGGRPFQNIQLQRVPASRQETAWGDISLQTTSSPLQRVQQGSGASLEQLSKQPVWGRPSALHSPWGARAAAPEDAEMSGILVWLRLSPSWEARQGGKAEIRWQSWQWNSGVRGQGEVLRFHPVEWPCLSYLPFLSLSVCFYETGRTLTSKVPERIKVNKIMLHLAAQPCQGAGRVCEMWKQVCIPCKLEEAKNFH